MAAPSKCSHSLIVGHRRGEPTKKSIVKALRCDRKGPHKNHNYVTPVSR